jgi:hypothetical protein
LIKICDENQYQKTVDLSVGKNSKNGKNSNLREFKFELLRNESSTVLWGPFCGILCLACATELFDFAAAYR